MRKLIKIISGVVLMSVQCLILASATASALIYTPINPSFGGNPLNGPVLLNTAQAINNFKDPALVANKKTPGQQLSETLQRSVISRLSFSAASGLVDSTGKLVATNQPLQTADFTITVTNLAGTGEMQVAVVDRYTGQTTTFSICQPGSAQSGIAACTP